MQIILELQNADSRQGTTMELEQPDYRSWCTWLCDIIESHVIEENVGIFRQGFIAEESVQAASRVRRYKGFRKLRLSDVDLLDEMEIADGAYETGAETEFLFSLLNAGPNASVNLFRLCLSWQSSGLLLSKKLLTIADLDAAFASALRMVSEGRSSSIAWDRQEFCRVLPEVALSAGLRGLNIGSTLRYQMACRAEFFDVLAAALVKQ